MDDILRESLPLHCIKSFAHVRCYNAVRAGGCIWLNLLQLLMCEVLCFVCLL